MDIDIQNLDEFHGFVDDNQFSYLSAPKDLGNVPTISKVRSSVLMRENLDTISNVTKQDAIKSEPLKAQASLKAETKPITTSKVETPLEATKDVVTKEDLKKVETLVKDAKIPEPPIEKVSDGGKKMVMAILGVGLIVGVIYFLNKTK
jgi:hypothetical protein